MRIDVQSHLPDLTRIRFVTRAMLERMAKRLLRKMHERMERGIGSDGNPMRPYTPAYRRARVAAGREGNRRTLTFTGRMKASRGIKSSTNRSVTMGWMAGPEALKAKRNEERTPFVQPTREEVAEVVRQLEREIAAEIQRQGLKGR